MPETNDVERNKALMLFRAKHFKELKKCLKASIEIRDSPLEARLACRDDEIKRLMEDYEKCADDAARIKNLKERLEIIGGLWLVARSMASVPPRDRNVAIRNIASMLGALTERGDVITKGKAKVRLDAPPVADALKDELEGLLGRTPVMSKYIKEKAREYQRTYRKRHPEKVLEANRKRDGLAGYGVYYWIKRNNYPDGFQVLCWNCNCSKAYSKDHICEHKRESCTITEKNLLELSLSN